VYEISVPLLMYLKVISIGTKKSFCTEGLLKLLNAILKTEPVDQDSMPNTLINKGVSVLIPFEYPKHLGPS